MKVRNINGISDNACRCVSWLKHWKNFGGQPITYCPVVGCLEKVEVGAHAQKDSTTDNSWYILPLCKKHNGKTGESLDISSTWTLVSANVSKTCGKK
jgi:hypothetical protein